MAGRGGKSGGKSKASVQSDFARFIHPLSVDEFLQEYWGKKIFASTLQDDDLKEMREGFHAGDISDLAAFCRKDDNSKFTSDEIENLEAQLESSKRTVNLPFCFSSGATRIKQAFIDSCPDLANDIEVGLYFSRAGGEPAQWHFDNNHNFTWQVEGEKDWLCIAGDLKTTCSRSMHEPARNAFEQNRVLPSVDLTNRTCYNLRQGSILYVPPGYWHSVIPNKGECFSVDLRVANMMHAKWLCEALFAELTSSPSLPPSLPTSLAPSDYGPGPVATAYAVLAAERAVASLTKCRMPRAFPFERHYSDGMETAATLEYLHSKGFLATARRDVLIRKGGVRVGVNPLVSITTKKRGADEAVLHMRSVSSLTASEYLRFSLICGAGLYEVGRTLERARSTTVAFHELIDLGRRDSKAGKGDVGSDVHVLMDVLLHANVLYADGEWEGAGEGDAKGSKRKRDV